MIFKNEKKELRTLTKLMVTVNVFLVLALLFLAIKKPITVKQITFLPPGNGPITKAIDHKDSIDSYKKIRNLIDNVFMNYDPESKDAFIQRMNYLRRFSTNKFIFKIKNQFLNEPYIKKVFNSNQNSSEILIKSVKFSNQTIKPPYYNLDVRLERRILKAYSQVSTVEEKYLVRILWIDDDLAYTKINNNIGSDYKYDGINGLHWNFLVDDIEKE